jgi:hypothetical protein
VFLGKGDAGEQRLGLARPANQRKILKNRSSADEPADWRTISQSCALQLTIRSSGGVTLRQSWPICRVATIGAPANFKSAAKSDRRYGIEGRRTW